MPEILRLGDKVEIKTGHPFKSSGFSESQIDVKLLRGDNIGQGRLRWDGAKRWPLGDVGPYRDFDLREGDIVLAMDRPWIEAGLKYAEVRSWDLPCLLVQRVARLRGNDSLDQRFLGYLIGGRAFTDYVLGIQTGTAVPHISATQIRDFRFACPPLTVQRAIAAVLGALDDKIAVNECIAATTRQLGVSLFAESIADGGESVTIEALSTYLNRGQAPKYTEDQDGLTVLNQKCVRDGRVNLDPARRTQASRVHAERRLIPGDVLVNSTGVGTLGRVGIWPHDLDATVDSHVTIVRINPAVCPPIVGAFAVLAVQPTIEAMGEGSTGQTELSRSKLGSVEVSLPFKSREILAAKLAALEVKSTEVLFESCTLAALRDTLLPGLMSGQLRVRDAERIVEDAV